MTVREYIGARYVPLFMGDWSDENSYEPLSIVQYQGNSYTSRQSVPSGISIDNTEYWAVTGNYNSQIEQYRQEVIDYTQSFNDDLADLQTLLEGEITELENSLDNFGNVANVMSYGAIGDGVTDDTEAIQAAIDSGYDVYIPKGTFLVSKSSEYSTLYPENDQPCLIIANKNGFKFFGNGKLKTNVHAQGILEIINSTGVIVNGINIEGYGNFPALDGNTGRGEKGTATEGYYTSGFWGYKKNNCYDTSEFTTHASVNNGQPWGTFGDGYIGNVGSGIRIVNSIDTVISNCVISGFNFSGVELGNMSDNSLNVCENVIISECIIKGIYSAGIGGTHANNLIVSDCQIYDIGHPNAISSNTNQDPGYGVGFNDNSNIVKNVQIENCSFDNCVRKAIDFHGGENLCITSNVVKNCMVGAVYVSQGANDNTGSAVISNNVISKCAYGTGSLAVITLFGGSSNPIKSIISNNLLKDSGSYGIEVNGASNVDICANTITGFERLIGSLVRSAGAINVRTFDNVTPDNICIMNNMIVDIPSGTYRWNIGADFKNGIIANNYSNFDSAGEFINLGSNSQKKISFNNISLSGEVGTTGSTIAMTIPFIGRYGSLSDSEANSIASHYNALAYKNNHNITCYVPRKVVLAIGANGTSSPIVTIAEGAEFVDSVDSQTYGFSIAFKNNEVNTIPACMAQCTRPFTAGTSAPNYNNVVCTGYTNSIATFRICTVDDPASGVTISDKASGTCLIVIML